MTLKLTGIVHEEVMKRKAFSEISEIRGMVTTEELGLCILDFILHSTLILFINSCQL